MLSGTPLQALIVTLCGLDFALYGYDQGVFGGVLLLPGFEVDFPRVISDKSLQGVVSSLFTLGCFFGCIISFFVSERLGRRRSMYFALTLLFIGAILQSSAYNLAHLIVGRIISGLGNGINTSITPVYQAETSKTHHRGRLVAAGFIINIFGYSLSNWFSYALLHYDEIFAWRIDMALQGIFIVPAFMILPFVPESPRWLVSHGKRDEARRVIAHLLGNELTPTDPEVTDFESLIYETVRHEIEVGTVNWNELFQGGKLQTFRRVLLGAACQFMQQATGSNIFSYYLPIILEGTMGYDKMTSSLVACIGSVVYMLAAIPPTWYIERVGRKYAVMAGSAGCSLCCIMLAISLCRDNALLNSDPDHAEQYGLWAVAFIFVFMISFGGSWLSVPWLYTAEIHTIRLRTKGAAIGAAFNWISNYMVVMITPPGQENLGWRFYIIFAIFNAVWVPILGFLYPETKGRSLEQMDALFEALEGKITVVGLDYSTISADNARNSTEIRLDEKNKDAVGNVVSVV